MTRKCQSNRSLVSQFYFLGYFDPRVPDILHCKLINCHEPFQSSTVNQNLYKCCTFGTLCIFPQTTFSPLYLHFSFHNLVNFPEEPPPLPVFICSVHKISVAKISEEPTTTTYSSADAPPEEGPVEFSPSIPPIFSTSNDPAPLLTVPSLSFFSGPSAAAPSVPKKRSSGAKKSLKEEVLKSLRAVSLSPVTTKAAPWPVQALLGELSAGVIAMILYKFTTTIEASLNRQILSDKFSRFRSSGAKKSLKEEAVESLRAVSLSPVTAKAVP
ncbi:uncharacterized protein LOC111395045 [Olea europaea var. sylvestris]|uniref:uncharacterized protein LOC111395045 n=1 Tax=Olea europaea var. sylvestris TaxID=158386 RepID=UPI000C1D00F1|nr:uncharacterized protein LOC111395045 [Olea europaea var. sylvestris]